MKLLSVTPGVEMNRQMTGFMQNFHHLLYGVTVIGRWMICQGHFLLCWRKSLSHGALLLDFVTFCSSTPFSVASFVDTVGSYSKTTIFRFSSVLYLVSSVSVTTVQTFSQPRKYTQILVQCCWGRNKIFWCKTGKYHLPCPILNTGASVTKHHSTFRHTFDLCTNSFPLINRPRFIAHKRPKKPTAWNTQPCGANNALNLDTCCRWPTIQRMSSRKKEENTSVHAQVGWKEGKGPRCMTSGFQRRSNGYPALLRGVFVCVHPSPLHK